MPELPEVETVCRQLRAVAQGRTIACAELRRADVLRLVDADGHTTRLTQHPTNSAPDGPRATAPHDPDTIQTALLAGQTVVDVIRHGKQMALVAQNGRVLHIHLGMSGQIRITTPGKGHKGETQVRCGLAVEAPNIEHPNNTQPKKTPGTPSGGSGGGRHLHAWWLLAGSVASTDPSEHPALVPNNGAQIAFVDPRRFGGLWAFESVESLQAARWSLLGPDALTLTDPVVTQQVVATLKKQNRPIKAALLDQALVAGIGNIYADEALFQAGIRPTANTRRVSAARCEQLFHAVVAVMRQAIAEGGSTLKDHVQTDGSPGSYQDNHQVYGRGGESCPRCAHILRTGQVAQRTTVWCPVCQR